MLFTEQCFLSLQEEKNNKYEISEHTNTHASYEHFSTLSFSPDVKIKPHANGVSGHHYFTRVLGIIEFLGHGQLSVRGQGAVDYCYFFAKIFQRS